MDGAAVHDSYCSAHQRAEQALDIAANVSTAVLDALVTVDTTGASVTLINPLGFSRTEPVRAKLPDTASALQDTAGRIIPVQRLDEEFVFITEDIPAFSTTTYRIITDSTVSINEHPTAIKEDADYFIVDTDFATSHISKKSGTIGSYYDKRLQHEFVAYGTPKYLTHVPTTRADLALNVFQIIDESPNDMSAWLVHDIIREESLLRNADVTLLENGPVFARFRVKHAFRSSTIEEDIIYYQQTPRIDFTAHIDWRERGSAEHGVPQLKVSFATAMSAARLRCEGPFCITEHPANGLDYPTQKWADLRGDEFGFALLNDAKYGCDALGGRLRMSLLRNPYSPDPETDNGRHTVHFAFLPHDGSLSQAALTRHGMAFNRAIITTLGQENSGHSPFLICEGSDAVVCTAFRPAEYSTKRLIRFFETSGAPATMTFTLGNGISTANVVNFLENPIEKAEIIDGKVVAGFHPYEVKTFLVEYA
jgi:alpha-mannosidase